MGGWEQGGVGGDGVSGWAAGGVLYLTIVPFGVAIDRYESEKC